MRRILHLDMDAFFAAVEQMRRPDLIGKPVIIGGAGDPKARGVVSTASYEARKYGVYSSMPLRTACKLCPQGIFLPVDYEAYSAVSGRIKQLLRDFCPVMEDVGIDEAFLDISDIDRASEEIAGEIKKRIKDETGLTGSIGIAPNKLLAKMASDMEKPDGLTILSERDIEARIWPLPVRKLWGIGPKTEAFLKGMGIETIGRIASLSLDRLTEMFGNSYGQYLYEASRGNDESPLVTHWEPKSVSREMTFQQDLSNWQAVAKNLVSLTEEVVQAMKEEGFQGRTVTVKVRFSDFRTVTRAKTFPQLTDSREEIRRGVFDCLARVELKRKIRLLGVRMGNLVKT